MPNLSLAFLGPVVIDYGARSLLPFRSVKVEALLAYLAVADALGWRAPPQREMLMELLWPGMPEASARQNLRQALYLLRQAIPHVRSADGADKVELVHADRRTISLNSAAEYDFDVRAFVTALQEETLAGLEGAVSLYRGEFLEDFYLADSNPFEAWAADYRARFRQMALDALARLVEHYETEQDFEQLERVARHWEDLDPLADSPQRALLRARALLGKWTTALSGYQAYEDRLCLEMEAEPPPLLQSLYEEVKLRQIGPPQAVRVEPPAENRIVTGPRDTPLHLILTTFVGREPELSQLREYLAQDATRLITTIGPGGVGKTRLALEAGSRFASLFPDGVFFISVEGLESDERLPTTIASVVGFAPHGSGPPWQQLARYLAQKRALLILDNFEDLIDAAPRLVSLLREAPALKILVTSQERLDFPGEWLLRLAGLALPNSDEGRAEESPAVQLFLTCARRVRPGYELTSENQSAVIRLCRSLEGLPLGIELAAAWTRMLSAAEIAVEIERSLDFVRTSTDDVPERHRSLRAAFDYAWQRLDEAERRLVCQLSVFRGGFTLAAAHAVVDANISALANLLDKSLLSATPGGEGRRMRYQMHAHVRQFAQERFQELPLAAETRMRHAAFFAELAAEQGKLLQGGDLLAAIAIFTVEIDNLRAAWRQSVTGEKFALLEQMIRPLLLFYEVRSWFREGFEQFGLLSSRSLAGDHDDGRRVLGYAFAVQGWFALRLADYKAADSLLAESLSLLQPLADRRGQAFALSVQALVDNSTGFYEEAQRHAEASLELCRTLADPLFKAFSLHNLGSVARMQRDFARARRRYREALALFRAIDNAYGLAFTLLNLGHVARLSGQPQEAREAFEEGQIMCRRIGYRYGLAVTLRSLGDIMQFLGAYDEAEKYSQQGLELAQELGDLEGVAWVELTLAGVAAARGLMGQAQSLAERSCRVFEQLGHRHGLALASGHLARIKSDRGYESGARRANERSLALFRELDNRWGVVFAYTNAGHIALAGDSFGEAAAAFAEALDIGAEIGALPLILEALAGVATLFVEAGEPCEAVTLFALIAADPAAPVALQVRAATVLARLQERCPDGVTSGTENESIHDVLAPALARLEAWKVVFP